MKKILVLLTSLITAGAIQASDSKTPSYFVDETKVYTNPTGTSYIQKNKSLCYNFAGLKEEINYFLIQAKTSNSHKCVLARSQLIQAHLRPNGTVTTVRFPYLNQFNSQTVQYVYHVISPDYSNNPAIIELILKNLFAWSDEQLVNTDLETKIAAVLKGLDELIATSQAQINVLAQQPATAKTTQATQPVKAIATTPKLTTTEIELKQQLIALLESANKLDEQTIERELTSGGVDRISAAQITTILKTWSIPNAPETDAILNDFIKTTFSEILTKIAEIQPSLTAKLEKEILELEKILSSTKINEIYVHHDDVMSWINTIIVYHPTLATSKEEVAAAHQYLLQYEGYQDCEKSHGPAAEYFEKNHTYRPGEDLRVMNSLPKTNLALCRIHTDQAAQRRLDQVDKLKNQVNLVNDHSQRDSFLNRLNTLKASINSSKELLLRNITRLLELSTRTIGIQNAIVLQPSIASTAEVSAPAPIVINNDALPANPAATAVAPAAPAAPAERKRDIAWRWAKRAGITAGAAAALLVAMSAERV